MNEIKNVFVYGTLKRDGGRGETLKDGGAIWTCNTCIYGYMLHRGAFPAVVLEEQGSRICGEMWCNVDADLLNELDHIEGVPNFYHRIPIELGNGCIAWTYVMPWTELTDKSQIIPSGDWYGKDTFSLTFEQWMKNVQGRTPPYKKPSSKPALVHHTVANCEVVRQYPRKEAGWTSDPIPSKPITPWEDGGCIPGVKLEWAGTDGEVVPDYEVKSQAMKGI